MPYPPGIPVLVPGQLVTRSIVEYLGGLLHSHKRMEMHGIVHEGSCRASACSKPRKRPHYSACSK